MRTVIGIIELLDINQARDKGEPGTVVVISRYPGHLFFIRQGNGYSIPFLFSTACYARISFAFFYSPCDAGRWVGRLVNG